MKSLKESLLDDIDAQIEDQTILYIDWIKEHYEMGKNTLLKFHDGVIDVDGNILLKQKATQLTNGQFKFGKMTGNFFCTNCNKLKTLEGAPEYVNGCFDCHFCASLVSLKGAPKYVDEFICYDCNNLKTLKGAPQKVGGEFDCSYCHKLTTLEGAPEEVEGKFFCDDCKNLKTLKGAPQKVGGDFFCHDCPKLIFDLNDIPYINPNKIHK